MFYVVRYLIFFSCFEFVLQITIWISSISFYAYADISFLSSSDVSSEIF